MLWKVPAKQALQLSAPGDDEKEPGSQGAQSADDDADKDSE